MHQFLIRMSKHACTSSRTLLHSPDHIYTIENMTLDYQQLITRHDPTHQYEVLHSYPNQEETGTAAAQNTDLSGIDASFVRTVVITGMGGSAIGGDLIRTLALDRSAVPIIVNRSYSVPGYVNEHTLVIVASYSGTTEETLSAFADATRRGAQIVVISSGEMLLERCAKHGIPCVAIPGGLPPRHAFGYLFFAMAGVCRRLDLLEVPEDAMREARDVLRKAVEKYASLDRERNAAIQIAERLHGMLPVLYAHGDRFECVLTRWRCQIEENAKMLAYSNVFPELNHNEIVGWEQHPDLLGRIAVVTFREQHEAPEIRKRIDITLDLLRPYAGAIIDVMAEEETHLGRVLGLICLGDWISFYLAIGTGKDPFPIQKINALKSALAHSS